MKSVYLKNGNVLIITNSVILHKKPITLLEFQADIQTYIKVTFLPSVTFLDGIYVYEGENVEVEIMQVSYISQKRCTIETPILFKDNASWIIVKNGEYPVFVTDCNNCYKLNANQCMIFPPDTIIQIIGTAYQYNYVTIYKAV